MIDFIKRMNLPNKLTLLRVALVPVFCIFISIHSPWAQMLAALVFVGASLTDWFDGKIARRDNLITDFGKLMDPIADKLLVTAAMVFLTAQHRMMAGVCTDVLGYFAGNLSMGAYFPGYTLTAVVGGLIWGLWLYPRKITVWRAIGAKTCINLFCNICLNTLWLTVTGGKAMSVLLVTRVPKNLILLPIEIVLVYFGMKLVNRIYGALPNGKTAAENS